METDFLPMTVVTGQRARKESRLRLDIRKRCFTVRMVRYWNSI